MQSAPHNRSSLVPVGGQDLGEEMEDEHGDGDCGQNGGHDGGDGGAGLGGTILHGTVFHGAHALSLFSCF